MVTLQRITRSERGQSLVELAVSLLFLLILLAGIIDMGRAVLAYFVLQDAAEEGMVYGTSFPTDCNQIDQRIRDNITTNIIDPNAMVISIWIQGDTGEMSCYSIPYAQVYATRTMRIEISADFQLTTPLLSSFIGGQTIPLRVETNGVILRPPPPS
jgi:hypothetical protein